MSRSPGLLLFDLKAGQTSLRGLGLLLGVYLGALLIAAVLAPPVYWLVEWLAGHFPKNGTLAYLAGKSFHDYYDRVRWVPIVLALPWLLKVCGLTGLSALGVRFSRRDLLLWAGLLVAGYCLFRLATLTQGWATDVVRKPERLDRSIALTLLSMLPGAVLIGLLEEVVFRGLVLRIFLSAFRSAWPAIVLGSLFFAAVHFKFPDPFWEGTGRVVEWHSGFYVAWWTLLGPLAEAQAAGLVGHFLASVVNYALLGVVLAVLFIRTGSLLACAGMHSGLVLAMLTYGRLYNVQAGEWHWLLGSTPIRDGLLATVLLTLALAAVLRLKRGLATDSDTTDSLTNEETKGA
ncbi:MAG: lysostaphin resistance A-like protein [Opitutales bacterium]